MIQLTGKEIHKEGNLSVNQHGDGYIISNGKKQVVVKGMPPLNAAALNALLGVTTYYEIFQINKHGNMVKEKVHHLEAEPVDPFDAWNENMALLEDMDKIGY